MYVFGYTGLTGFIDAWTTWFQILKLLSAIAGTWVYGLVREKLPH